MKDLITVILGAALIVAVLCIGPMLFLWFINTLAEQAGSSFHIAHGFWSYLASVVLMVIFAGSSKASL